MSNMHRYPSLSAAIEDYRRLGFRAIPSHERRSANQEKIIEQATRRDLSVVSQAEALLRKVEASIELPTTQWMPSVVGAYPIVPDALAGVPDAMRMRSRVSSEQVPLSICVFGSMSAGISPDQYRARGIAILALVLALQQFRPVTLEVFNIGLGDYVNSAMINTTPMDLATASVLLSSASCMSAIFYGLEYAYTGTITWPIRYTNNRRAYMQWIRGPLGLSDADLLIEPAFFLDFDNDHVGWINNQVKRFTENLEETYP